MEQLLTPQYPVQYPMEYPAPPPKESRLRQISEELNYDRKYTITSLVLLFFLFSFFGWCWEVLLFLLKDGILVNRGTLFGPWLPIYGTGGVIILLFMRRWAYKPVLTFFLVMLACSVLEFSTSWVLEALTGMRWWDYSGYFLNIQGRVYLLGALTFATGGSIFIYFLGPALDNILLRIPQKSKICMCLALVCLFTADSLYSHKHPNTGEGVTDYSSLPLWSAERLPDRR